VRLLLDTHSFVWFIEGSPRLSSRAREFIEADTAEVFVSAATGWEITTKHRLGKLPNVEALVMDFEGEVRRAGMTGLAITLRHAAMAGSLAGDHRDPFDRILSAQSLCDNLIFISNDEILDRFGISRIW
jgi:PIN domain nuclease of toxin-antitoxin system